MKLLTVDPSTTAIGYAISTGFGPDHLTDGGLLLPAKKSASAFDRIKSMRLDLIELIQEHEPDVTLLEWPSAHVHGAKKGGGGAGLAIYGVGVGVALGACIGHCKPGTVQVVDANTWTRRVKKEKRARAIAYRYPKYEIEKDPGFDFADAIGLKDWYFTHTEIVADLNSAWKQLEKVSDPLGVA